MARLRLGRPGVLRLRLLRAALRAGGEDDPGRNGLRRQPQPRGDPRDPGRFLQTRPGQPPPQPHRRGEPGPLPAHEGRRVPRRRPCSAREGGHGVEGREDARPGDVPDQARPPPPHRKQVVHLPDVRLGPRAERLPGKSHPLHLLPGVRQPPPPLPLVPRPDRRPRRRPTPADRVRQAELHLHRAQQAQAPAARAGQARQRLGRPPHAHARRHAPPRLHPGGAPRAVRPGGRLHPRQRRRHRPAGARAARAPQRHLPPGDGRAPPAQGGDRELARGPRRCLPRPLRPGEARRPRPRRPLRPRALHRARRLRRGATQEVVPPRPRAGGPPALRLHPPMHRRHQGRTGRGRRATLHLGREISRRGRPRRTQDQGDAPLGLRAPRAPRGGAPLRPPLQGGAPHGRRRQERLAQAPQPGLPPGAHRLRRRAQPGQHPPPGSHAVRADGLLLHRPGQQARRPRLQPHHLAQGHLGRHRRQGRRRVNFQRKERE